MKHLGLQTLALAFSVLVVPLTALADSNATLASGQELNMTSGAVGTSGGDIQWTGTALNFVGSAKGFDVPGSGGTTTYTALTQTIVQSEAIAFSTTGIPASALVSGNIFVLQLNGGGYAKAMVTANSGGSLSIEYSNFGSSTGSGGPSITNILNNYSYIPAGFSNSGIPPSSIFTIFGSALATTPAGGAVLSSSAAPGLPTTLNGATISVSAGGKTYTPAMYYAIATQIAAVMPAAVPVGAATVTVNYNNQSSNQFQIQIVQSAVGLDTYYGTGSGLVVATDNNTGALITYTNSAKPSEAIDFWGSGSGGDAADSDTTFANTPHAVNQSATQIYIGGVQAPLFYAGSSGYPGFEQFVVTVPSGLSGCGLSVVVVVNGVASNFGTLPVAQGGGSCTEPIFGVTGTQISTLSGQSTVRSGTVFVFQETTPSNGTFNDAEAIFSSNTGSAYGSSGITSAGSCTVSEVNTSTTSTSTPLDAGGITLTGPAGTYQLSELQKGQYIPSTANFQLPAGAIPSTGGTFTFNNGSGGPDVGAFTASVTMPNPLLNWTNQSAAATITRANGLTVTWTAGSSGTYVIISGNSSNSSTGVSGSYTCYAPQSALTFTVPSYVLGTLPAGTGTTLVENVTSYAQFTKLPSNLDHGVALGATLTQVNSNYN